MSSGYVVSGTTGVFPAGAPVLGKAGSVVCGVCGLTRVGGGGGSGVITDREGGVAGRGCVVCGVIGVLD